MMLVDHRLECMLQRVCGMAHNAMIQHTEQDGVRTVWVEREQARQTDVALRDV